MPDATIVVLGAGPGMGRAVAHRFGTAGFRVALVARCSSRLDVLRAEVVRDGIDGRRPRPLQRGRRPVLLVRLHQGRCALGPASWNCSVDHAGLWETAGRGDHSEQGTHADRRGVPLRRA